MDTQTATVAQPAATAGIIRRAAGRARRVAVDFVLPPQCAACGGRIETAGHVCGACWRGLAFIAPPYCAVTGVPFAFDPGGPSVSLAARMRPPAYDRARAAVRFGEVSRALVHALKYRDRHDVAALMARLMAQAGDDILADAPLIAPVPLHWSRLWRRRFNQSAVLAGALSRSTGLAMRPDMMVRTRATRQQVGLSTTQRKRNVAGAFRLAPGAQGLAAGAHVLLVDDVRTTGATIEACARALKRAGARRVDVLTFALVAQIIDNPV